MTHPSKTDTIEAGIERDRASLASTVSALKDRVSVENLAHEALDLVKTNAAAYTHSLDSAVRSNALAFAVTGAGIAWMVFGGRKTDKVPTRQSIDRWEDDSEWARDIDTLRDRASGQLQRIEAEAKSYAKQVGDGVAEGLDEARDFVAERATVVGDFADEMKAGFRKGLDDLTDAAREQIIAARERAYAARIRAEKLARGGTREAARMIEEHPLVAGVVALAIGAAFAATLPRTRVEDRTFGAESDRLMHQANMLVKQERERLGRVAAGVTDELKEAGRSAVASVSETVADAAEAVKERAKDEADAALSAKPVASAEHGGKGARS